MRGLFRVLIPVVASFSAIQMFPQNPAPQSKILNGFTQQQVDSLRERRWKGQQEINRGRNPFDAEAKSLSEAGNTIALVRVTDFKLRKNTIHSSLLYLHVEHVLRGAATEAELSAATCWAPPDGDKGIFIFNACQLSNLAHTKPEIGAEYLIGYRILPHDPANIWGALVMDFPEQAAYLPEVERFLDIESEVSDTNLAPFIAALNDSVPWIQDVAAERLISSTVCTSSTACLSAITAAATRMLSSKNACVRTRALFWIGRLAQKPGVPQRHAAIQQLLAGAANDPNEAIAEDAFSDLARLEFRITAAPGDCIEIVPVLRKVAHWTAAETKGGQVGGQLWSAECMPEPPPAPAQ